MNVKTIITTPLFHGSGPKFIGTKIAEEAKIEFTPTVEGQIKKSFRESYGDTIDNINAYAAEAKKAVTISRSYIPFTSPLGSVYFSTQYVEHNRFITYAIEPRNKHCISQIEIQGTAPFRMNRNGDTRPINDVCDEMRPIAGINKFEAIKRELSSCSHNSGFFADVTHAIDGDDVKDIAMQIGGMPMVHDNFFNRGSVLRDVQDVIIDNRIKMARTDYYEAALCSARTYAQDKHETCNGSWS